MLACSCRGSLETDCFDVNGQSSCFVGSLDTPSACQPLGDGDTNVTQPLQDMLADGSASDGSDGGLCRLYDDAGASIGALNVTACAQGLACTPLQVRWAFRVTCLMVVPPCLSLKLCTYSPDTTLTAQTARPLLIGCAGVFALASELAPSESALKMLMVPEHLHAILQVQPLVGSGFGYCSSASGNATGAVDAALPPTAGGLASLSQYNVVPRTTVIGERCRLPVVYG